MEKFKELIKAASKLPDMPPEEVGRIIKNLGNKEKTWQDHVANGCRYGQPDSPDDICNDCDCEDDDE